MAESGASTDCSADDNGLATPGQTREFSLDINACDERFENDEYFQRIFLGQFYQDFD